MCAAAASAASASGAGRVRAARGRPGACGSGATPSAGPCRAASAAQAAPIAAASRLPANHCAGVSPWPATSQLSRLRVLSVVLVPCRALRQVAARDEHAAVHGARQRDVDEAQVLGGALEPRAPLHVGVVELAVEALAEVDHGAAGVVVVLDAVEPVGEAAAPPVPQEGAEHDRVLEPLGLVDGDDLHQVLVGLEAQLRRVVAALVAALGLEPAQQRVGRGVRLGRLVQALGQVQQVGQAPLAVAAQQQAFGARARCASARAA